MIGVYTGHCSHLDSPATQGGKKDEKSPLYLADNTSDFHKLQTMHGHGAFSNSNPAKTSLGTKTNPDEVLIWLFKKCPPQITPRQV